MVISGSQALTRWNEEVKRSGETPYSISKKLKHINVDVDSRKLKSLGEGKRIQLSINDIFFITNKTGINAGYVFPNVVGVGAMGSQAAAIIANILRNNDYEQFTTILAQAVKLAEQKVDGEELFLFSY